MAGLVLSGRIEEKRTLCSRLIHSLGTANALVGLQNEGNISRHLNYALREVENARKMNQGGTAQIAEVYLQSADIYITNVRGLWGEAVNQGLSDIQRIRNLYTQMRANPQNFDDGQIDDVRFLINWFDGLGRGEMFAFGSKVVDISHQTVKAVNAIL